MTNDMKSDRRRARIAKLMDKFGAGGGDERFRRAAGVLRGKQAGRRAVDDSEALAYAKSLFTAGCSKNAACIQAAMMYSPKPRAFDATKARLLRKLVGTSKNDPFGMKLGV